MSKILIWFDFSARDHDMIWYDLIPNQYKLIDFCFAYVSSQNQICLVMKTHFCSNLLKKTVLFLNPETYCTVILEI